MICYDDIIFLNDSVVNFLFVIFLVIKGFKMDILFILGYRIVLGVIFLIFIKCFIDLFKECICVKFFGVLNDIGVIVLSLSEWFISCEIGLLERKCVEVIWEFERVVLRMFLSRGFCGLRILLFKFYSIRFVFCLIELNL